MRIQNATVDRYRTFLQDKYRPPSKGGNTRAWHLHVLDISGDSYTFYALGTKKWVFQNDTVSFEWEWDKNQAYRNILPHTVVVTDPTGNPALRGNRGSKPWRTAEARMPVSRREWRD
ncbi:hypothetical protein [Nitratireductor luteus]|uniref:hypothetical protein n=1 Tax=Nitratireductor luteus TaxID=2976980 RepID=UPI002240DC1E|nr:hypothetical protein [Nitratireductor luteus]